MRRARRLFLLAAASAFAGAARAAAPVANFSLQWRVLPWPAAPVASTAPGSITVSSSGATTATGGVTAHTAVAEAHAQRLVLRNGGQARIAQLRDAANDPPDFVWTPQGQGIASARRRPARRESLWVQVQWPGGHAPATLAYRFEQPLSDPGSADAAQQLDGELAIPFDQWVPVGHWAGPDGAGQGLELRLTRLP